MNEAHVEINKIKGATDLGISNFDDPEQRIIKALIK